MKKISQLTLTGPGTQAMLERGKLELGKGRQMMALRLLMTASLVNNSGTSRALTDAERQAFLEGWSLKLSYGRNQRRKPLNMVTLTRVQKLARFLIGSDWEGYGNTTTGLARTLTAGGTTQVQLYITIPTGRIWQLGRQSNLFGVGRTQARTMQLEVFRKSDVLPSGFSVFGNVTLDVLPEDVSRKGPERWWYLPEWVETDETDRVARLPDGLVLLAVERSAALAASALSDVRAAVDGEELYTNMSVQQANIPMLDVPNFPAVADISDRDTVLYQLMPNMELRDCLSGSFTLEQISKTLGTCRLGGLICPLPEDQEVREDVQDAAGKNGRNKTIKATNGAVVDGVDLPPSVVGYAPMVLLDPDDKEFQQFPGMVSQDGQLGAPFVPDSVVANARHLNAAHKAVGEEKVAENGTRTVALAIPGAQQDKFGFARKGSPVLSSVRTLVQ